MFMNDRKARAFRREFAEAPENIVFYRNEVLCEVASDENAPPEARRYALAGLLARYVLSPSRLGSGEAKRLLDGRWGSDAAEKFRDLCALCERRESGMNVDLLFRHFAAVTGGRIPGADLSAIEDVSRRMLSADGFIPVFSAAAAYLLPFHFVKRDEGRATVVDSRGNELAEWSEYLEELTSVKDDVCVDVRTDSPAMFTGDSLMLPVLMASWRREGAEHFPQYSTLRLYATGSMHAGWLGCVDTAEKISKVAEIDESLLVRPVHCAEDESIGRGCIRAGTSLEKCREDIAAWAEEMTVCDPVYAMKRMASFDRRVRSAKGQDWNTVRAALENLTSHLDQELEPDAYLLGLMLRSAAACHAGDAVAASVLNDKAAGFAAGGTEHEADLLRIKIEQLVILQDREDFPGVERLAPGVEEALESYAKRVGETLTVRDLRMRFHGTMGQALAAMSVSGDFADPARCVAESKRHCETAYEMALEIYREVSARNAVAAERLEATANLVQDANYLVMWSAFHDFGNLEDRSKQAESRAGRLCNFDAGSSFEGSERCRTNAGYRERFRLMGWYREMLKGNSVDARPLRFDWALLDDDKAEKWTRVLCCKYLGAMAAAMGVEERAYRLFKKANEIIAPKNEEFRNGILGTIHMTVLAEAFHSLRNTFYAEFAEDARRRALALLGAPENADWHKEAWKEYLEHPDDKPYPALTYWY